MSSPLPGMDPYLECAEFWPAFHHELVTSLYQGVLPGLVDRYRARIGQRSYTTEQALLTSVVRDEHLEEFIEIRPRGETRLTTLVEVVSPQNKGSADGRHAYLAKRHDARLSGANLVEIDLTLEGEHIFDCPCDRAPGHDYAIVVTRFNQPDRPEIWTTSLQKRLPPFKLPLARNDRDLMVELQNAFSRAYDRTNFSARIDYGRDPSVHLSAENRQWLDQHLRDHTVR